MSSPLPPTLRSLIETRRAIVCCGAGGVGKTTVAASLSVAAARLGRRVLVLTIDPSKRLAQALGVAQNPPKPVPLPLDRQRDAGIQPPGSLEAWMFDPKLICDEAVLRFARENPRAQSLLDNRIYQQATSMVAGLHEYTAMKALHGFLTNGHYDLVILDTPPSRNALDFLDAPNRLSRFFDGGLFKLFLPSGSGLLKRASNKLIEKILKTVFGEEFAAELRTFLEAFSGLFTSLSTELQDVRKLLSQDDAAFLLVTTPTDAAVAEALFFHDRILQLGLPFRGFLLNKSSARAEKDFPSPALLPPDASEALKSAFEKLKWLGRTEELEASRDRGILAELGLRSGSSAFAIPLPPLLQGASDISTLNQLADRILLERRSGR